MARSPRRPRCRRRGQADRARRAPSRRRQANQNRVEVVSDAAAIAFAYTPDAPSFAALASRVHARRRDFGGSRSLKTAIARPRRSHSRSRFRAPSCRPRCASYSHVRLRTCLHRRRRKARGDDDASVAWHVRSRDARRAPPSSTRARWPRRRAAPELCGAAREAEPSSSTPRGRSSPRTMRRASVRRPQRRAWLPRARPRRAAQSRARRAAQRRSARRRAREARRRAARIEFRRGALRQ